MRFRKICAATNYCFRPRRRLLEQLVASKNAVLLGLAEQLIRAVLAAKVRCLETNCVRLHRTDSRGLAVLGRDHRPAIARYLEDGDLPIDNILLPVDLWNIFIT